jgi:trk system potassium uptake protein TrkA
LDKKVKKQVAVVGIGNFGFYLAVELFQKGHEVLGIDINPRPVQEIRDQVSRAVIADATDTKALRELELEKTDTVVISIGSDLNNSILATLNVKDMGVKHVVAKAVSEAHGRILKKIGADDIYFPEKDLALAAARRIDNPNVLDYLPFMEGYSIVQLAPPQEFLGKNLIELDLINRFGLQIIAVKKTGSEEVVMIPTGHYTTEENDALVLLGPESSIAKLKEKLK